MVPLERGEAPAILVRKAADWTARYLERRKLDASARPLPSQYRHEGVLVELRRMNGNKCSYCERLLAEPEQEVDHHVEVAECPERAFDWSNLYLSCAPCNSQKAPNRQVPVAACVDPCAPGVQPDAHLTFDDERIEARNASTHGRSTIQKYRLDWQDLDLARSKILNTFAFALDAIRQRQLVDGGRDLSDEEREILRAFATPARPFSLMMKLRLTRLSL